MQIVLYHIWSFLSCCRAAISILLFMVQMPACKLNKNWEHASYHTSINATAFLLVQKSIDRPQTVQNSRLQSRATRPHHTSFSLLQPPHAASRYVLELISGFYCVYYEGFFMAFHTPVSHTISYQYLKSSSRSLLSCSEHLQAVEEPTCRTSGRLSRLLLKTR